jgi:hypothetical protein
MKRIDNALYDISSLFMCDAWRLGKYHGEPSLMSLDLGVIPFLERDILIVLLMFHGGPSACFRARVEDLGFDESKPSINL